MQSLKGRLIRLAYTKPETRRAVGLSPEKLYLFEQLSTETLYEMKTWTSKDRSALASELAKHLQKSRLGKPSKTSPYLNKTRFGVGTNAWVKRCVKVTRCGFEHAWTLKQTCTRFV